MPSLPRLKAAAGHMRAAYNWLVGPPTVKTGRFSARSVTSGALGSSTSIVNRSGIQTRVATRASDVKATKNADPGGREEFDQRLQATKQIFNELKKEFQELPVLKTQYTLASIFGAVDPLIAILNMRKQIVEERLNSNGGEPVSPEVMCAWALLNDRTIEFEQEIKELDNCEPEIKFVMTTFENKLKSIRKEIDETEQLFAFVNKAIPKCCLVGA
jgi:hypothetical protein